MDRHGSGWHRCYYCYQEKKWIADVGFGADTTRAPIPLELDRPTTLDGQMIRLVQDERFGIMVRTVKEEQWLNLCSFDLGYVCPADIDYGNHYNATHPGSLFVFARVAMLPVKNGAITLFDNTLKNRVGEKEIVQELEGGQPYLDALKSHFGIELDAPYEELRPLPETDLRQEKQY